MTPRIRKPGIGAATLLFVALSAAPLKAAEDDSNTALLRFDLISAIQRSVQATCGADWSNTITHLMRARTEDMRMPDFGQLSQNALQGDRCTALAVGLVYTRDYKDHPHNDLEAAKYLRIAADSGEPVSEAFVSEYYYEGSHGFPHNEGSGKVFLQTSAQQRFAFANLHMGMYFYDGTHGMPQDRATAIQQFIIAANGGSVTAAKLLSAIYERGDASIGLAPDTSASARYQTMATQLRQSEDEAQLKTFQSASQGSAGAGSVAPAPASAAQDGSAQDANGWRTVSLAATGPVPTNAQIAVLYKKLLNSLIDHMSNESLSSVVHQQPAGVWDGQGLSPKVTQTLDGILDDFGGQWVGPQMRYMARKYRDAYANAIVTVVSKRQYEGNWIAYVSVRQPGSDKSQQDKIILTRQGALWLATNDIVSSMGG